MGTEKRERQKAARQEKIEQLRKVEKRNEVKHRGLMIAGIVAAVLIGALVFSIFTSDAGEDDEVASDDSTTTTASTTTAAGDSVPDETTPDESTPTETTIAAVVPGPTECPAVDGSSERTIDFGGTFANCLTEGVDYQAKFVTSEGDVVVDLLEDTMPNTVNNFVALSRYHYYDGTKMFRTDPSIAIIQGGSPHTESPSDPGPGFSIPDEGGVFSIDPATGQPVGPFTYQEGQLIMARSKGLDSSSAQYFFSTGPEVSRLDSQGTYLLFGEVTEGLDVLQSIMALHEADPTSQLGGGPSRDVIVESVEIIEAA